LNVKHFAVVFSSFFLIFYSVAFLHIVATVAAFRLAPPGAGETRPSGRGG